MQKWLPDEFTATIPERPAPGPRWERLAADTGPGAGAPRLEERFQRESRFADPNSLMANLTQAERGLIYELAEQDVAREYEDRENALKADLEKQLNEARADYEQRIENWSGGFAAELAGTVESGLGEIARSAATLAVQLAGKITRSLVPIDDQILVRGIQTALFKIPGNHPIHLVAHPDDADWLKSRPELLSNLNIGEITCDRRLQRGGCLVQSGGREVDATLDGQLEALSEVVEEAIATAGSEDPVSPRKEEHDPGLE